MFTEEQRRFQVSFPGWPFRTVVSSHLSGYAHSSSTAPELSANIEKRSSHCLENSRVDQPTSRNCCGIPGTFFRQTKKECNWKNTVKYRRGQSSCWQSGASRLFSTVSRLSITYLSTWLFFFQSVYWEPEFRSVKLSSERTSSNIRGSSHWKQSKQTSCFKCLDEWTKIEMTTGTDYLLSHALLFGESCIQ